MKRIVSAFAVLAVLALLVPARLMAAGTDVKGWEHGGEYDQLYNNDERDKFKARIKRIIDVTPMPGMAQGVGLVVEDRDDGELVDVHLGPKGFVEPRMGFLRPGMLVKLYGVWVEMDGKDVFIAAKVKKNDNEQLKVRLTSSGKAFWNLPPEELAKEENDNE